MNKKSTLGWRTLAVASGLASGLMIGGAPARAAVDPVLPETEIVTLKRGFRLVLRDELSIPITNGYSVFVVQGARLHPGTWGWRNGKFIVLSELGDPSTDIALDTGRPSCQVHYSDATSPLVGSLRFKPMMFAGSMNAGHISMYSALQSPDEKIFLNCLTAEQPEPGPAPFRVKDLLDAWPAQLGTVERVKRRTGR